MAKYTVSMLLSDFWVKYVTNSAYGAVRCIVHVMSSTELSVDPDAVMLAMAKILRNETNISSGNGFTIEREEVDE